MINIKNLTKTFNKGNIVALNNISCKIQSNKIVGLVGPDGAGKTTLLRILAGVMHADSGEVLVQGQNLDIGCQTKPPHNQPQNQMTIDQLHHMIAYMPQKFGLYEDLSVMENLNLYAELHNCHENRKSAFEAVLSLTRLQNFTTRLAGNLSGGMKQKLGLACALLKNPQILILDEPSVGVDPISRKELISMVHSMLSNTTVIWSTAYLDEAENLDHILLLHNGEIIFDGAPQSAIKNVEGKVYFANSSFGCKRQAAADILKIDDVVDSFVQGNHIRFLTKTSNTEKITTALQSIVPNADNIVKAKPTFEDACIDILGGMSYKDTPIADWIKDLNLNSNKSENVVEAISLHKKFGDFTAVEDLSFTLKRGKILGLLGPNGSGKSTTFRMLCGLTKQTSGSAKIVGFDIEQIGEQAKMNLGYMAQKFSLYKILSVRQNLDFFSGAYRLSGKDKKEAVENMLDIFHMRELQNISASSLSLGYKQRLALACAIMHKPQVLFLDEPTSGVDVITRKEFWLHINAMVAHGVSVVVTTHFIDEAENCDEIALIYNGKLMANGTPDHLKSFCKNQTNPTLEAAFIDIISDADRINLENKVS